MSIEKALITRAQPYFLAAKAQDLIQKESIKGCSEVIYPLAVPLEPPFKPISTNETPIQIDSESEILGQPFDNNYETLRVRAWISPEQIFNWIRNELFIKSIKSFTQRVGLEIIGNSKIAEVCFLVSYEDLPQLVTAFKSQFDKCELTLQTSEIFSQLSIRDWHKAQFYDYYPAPPYSHLFTQPDEFTLSPFDIILTAFADIKPPAVGFYQLIFQGTSKKHNWHRNISILLDFEYAVKLMTGLPMSQKVPFQPPSGELRGMAQDNENKAHNDKPIYTAAMRIGVVGTEDTNEYIQKLNLCPNLFQHGGQPLQTLSQDDYNKVIQPDAIQQMFTKGYTHRPGFIINSSELSGMVHMPPAEIFKHYKQKDVLLETLPAKSEDILHGTPIGTCEYAGTTQNICISPKIRSRSTHLIARHGMGKSTLLENMVLDDISNGAGVAVLDPHGDLIYRLLHLIPEKYVDKTVYLFPGDANWIPLWNPIHIIPNQDVSKTTDDIVASIKNIVQGWGDRLENLLRFAISGLLLVPGSSLLDVSNLLRKNSVESERLIQQIKKVIDSKIAKTFWEDGLSKYSNQDLNPPQHKLSKFLMSGNVSLMLSQPENKINFREIMDSGKILLIDLSGIGSDLRELLGSLILSFLHITALSRSDILIDQRKQFHVYCDEAHRFLTSTFEDMIAETRKFAVSMTLAHQYLRQFDRDMRDAILTAGSTIIFNVDMNDARYLAKDLQDLVKPEDMATFEVGDAIARIGTNIVKITTKEQVELPSENYCQKIIEESHRKYYKPVQEIKNQINENYQYSDDNVEIAKQNNNIDLYDEQIDYNEFE